MKLRFFLAILAFFPLWLQAAVNYFTPPTSAINLAVNPTVDQTVAAAGAKSPQKSERFDKKINVCRVIGGHSTVLPALNAAAQYPSDATKMRALMRNAETILIKPTQHGSVTAALTNYPVEGSLNTKLRKPRPSILVEMNWNSWLN